MFFHSKTVLLKNSDVTQNCKEGTYLDPETFYNLTDLLDSHREYWLKCSYFIIEQQMNFGRFKRNTMALKLAQHTYSYFVINYGRFKTVVDFPSYHKTQVLGAEKVKGKGKRWKTMGDRERKKWSVEIAQELVIDRDDMQTLSIITSMKKKDDVCDCILQAQAFKVLEFIN